MLEQLKAIISPLAPALGGMLGGPAGVAIGAAIRQVLCNDTNASADDIAAALSSPDAIIKLKELENQQLAAMLQNQANARAMQMETKSRVPEILTYSLLGLIVYLITIIALCDVNQSESKLLNHIVEIMSSSFISCISFWFGFIFQKKWRNQ
jgi:hypothetical protein